MSKSIPLTQLVTSDSFLEGSSIYRSGSVVVLSASTDKSALSVDGILRSFPEKKISLSIDTVTGEVGSSSCGFGCSGICSHIIGLALFYNEIEVEGLNPLEQLTSFSLKNTALPENRSYNIIPGKKSIDVDISLTDPQMSSIVQMIGKGKFPALAALFPERFSIAGIPLKPAATPLNLMYSTGNACLKFFLPPGTFFYDDSSVVIDTENSFVWRFDEKTGKVLSTLLNLSMNYDDRGELTGVVSVLSENLAPFIELQGDINVEKIPVNGDTPVVFEAVFENGKISLKVLFETTAGRIDFKPKRKNLEQNYPAKGKMFVIDPELIKNIRAALTNTGFRYVRNSYTAPGEKYHKMISQESPLKKIGTVVFRNDFRKVSFTEDKADESEIEFDLNVSDKWFSFRVKLPESMNYINPEELIKAVKQIEQGIEEPVITDSSGSPVILEKSSSFLKRISDMLPSTDTRSWQKLPFGHLLKMLNNDSRKVIKNFYGPEDSEAVYREIFATIKKGKVPDIDIPSTIREKLRNYQVEGLKWLTLLRTLRLGGVLADEMGLGKTIQSLAMIKMEDADKPSMVVAPKTLIWSWDREIEKFFPEMKRVVIDSLKPEERIRKWKNCSNELIITSYSIAVNDLRYIKDREFKTIIIDEAQHIKNSQTKRFRALISLKSEHKFALTGTPIENHIRDLWSIFHFVMPGYMGNRKDIDGIEKRGELEEISKLSSLTAPFMLRRTKKETLSELPELTVKEYPVEMTMRQKEVYLSVLLRGRAEYLESKDEMTSFQILSILSRLRLAANHPSLAKEADFPVDDSGKILTILELVDEILSADGKVLIFSQYVKMLKLIEKSLLEQRVEYFYMDGKTKERMELVKRFNDGERPVFLLSLKVGGVGLNLTGADNVIIVDPWWNPAAEEQAWSRAHRIGQEKRVVVHKLFSKGTIEEKIIDMQEKKKGLTDHFMSKTIKDPSEDFIRMVADMELAING